MTIIQYDDDPFALPHICPSNYHEISLLDVGTIGDNSTSYHQEKGNCYF